MLTGTRAEYGLLTSLLEAIRAHPALRLRFVVTGMHLLKSFGYTIDDIRRDGWRIDLKIPIYTTHDDRRHLPNALAKLVDRLGTWLGDQHIDIVVVLGDRIEALGGALAAMTAGIPLAHIHGGDQAPGDMDDRIRFAISDLANLHFPATEKSRRRLIRAGQPPQFIHTVGALAMDQIYHTKCQRSAKTKANTITRLGLNTQKEIFIVVYHPCAYGADGEYRRMTTLLKTVRPYQGLIIAPNCDPGYSGVIRAIKTFRRNPAVARRWKFALNLDRTSYLQALYAADVLVGNSSSALLEANPLGTAVVNVGPRQQGRQHNGNAIFDCSYAPSAIRQAVRHALAAARTRKIRPSSTFGSGHTGHTIAQILAKTTITRNLLIKQHL